MTSYTDETVSNLIINKLTKEQYESILTPSSTELYVITDEDELATKMVVDSFTATANQTTFALTNKCINKNYLTVNVSNTELTSSAYSLSNDGMSVTLTNGVSEGDLVDLRYFTNINIGDAGATFTPSVTKSGYTTTLSWTNDRSLPNPSNVTILDGIKYVPAVSKSGYTTTISWSNDQGGVNPDTVQIKDGIKYVPSVTKSGYTTTLSWTNDQEATNPDTVQIKDGIKYVPAVSKSGYTTTISWSNDQGATNPNTVTITDGNTFTPTVTTVNDYTETISWTNNQGAQNPNTITVTDGNTFTPTVSKSGYTTTISWDNDQEATNPPTVTITDGCTFTPHVSKSGYATTLSWTNDQDKTNPSNVTINDGVIFTPSATKSGYTTTLSWTNDQGKSNPPSVSILDGVIWTPSQTKSGRTATISWTNNQGKTNPSSINLYDGVVWTPSVTTDITTNTATISWSNDGGLQNPQDVTLYLGNDNSTQRWVDSFTATANQTQFVATRDIESVAVLSVNIENTELLQSSYTLGVDKRTVTIVDPVEAGARVELKYFHNLLIAKDGTTFTPAVTATTGGYNLSWTNDGGKSNPSTVFINSVYAVGTWSSSNTYKAGNLVTYEDSNYYYGYIAKQNVPASTALTNTTYWTLAYATAKQYIAATVVDWGE